MTTSARMAFDAPPMRGFAIINTTIWEEKLPERWESVSAYSITKAEPPLSYLLHSPAGALIGTYRSLEAAKEAALKNLLDGFQTKAKTLIIADELALA